MNDLIHNKLKEIVNLKDIIKTDNLRYKSKSRICLFFAYCFLRDIHERNLSLKDANDEQKKFCS